MKRKVFEITSKESLMPIVAIEFTSEREAEKYAEYDNISKESYIITWYLK
jgi:hypothetical protein